MEAQWLSAIVNVIALLLSVGAALYTWFANRERATRQQIEAVKGSVQQEATARARSNGELRDRVKSLEVAMPHMPSQESFHQMGLRMEQMHGDMNTLSERMKGMSGQLDTINNFLMKQDR